MNRFICKQCQFEYVGRKKQKYCSVECKNKHHNSENYVNYYTVAKEKGIENLYLTADIQRQTNENRELQKQVELTVAERMKLERFCLAISDLFTDRR